MRWPAGRRRVSRGEPGRPQGVTLALLSLALLVFGATGGASPQPPAGGPDPGQSATLLPDGRWLLVGGDGPAGPRADAVLHDPRTGQTIRLAPRLSAARTAHTATLLPDGTVLVVGGRGADGALVAAVERVDLAAMAIEPVRATGLTPRAGHTATVLTDGQLLIAGGIGPDGQPVGTLDRWDPRTRTATVVSPTLPDPRIGHTASLLADGRVLLWGGGDPSGRPLADGAVYDPAADTVHHVAQPPRDPADTGPPGLVESIPADGAVDVALDAPVGLRVAPPVRVEGVTDHTVTLQGPAGPVAARVVAVEEGRVVFVTPDPPLEPGTTYTLTVHGWTDATGRAVPFTTVTFTTRPAPATGSAMPPTAPDGADARAAAPAEPARDDGIWQPDLTRGLDGWQTGLPPSPWTQLPPLQARRGITALAGQVLTLWGDPLRHVTLSIGRRHTRTDATGRFLLTHVPAGLQELLIDGRSASRPRRPYGVFEVGVTLMDGRTTPLGYTIWMPVLDLAHAVTLPSPTPDEVVVTTPRIPGLEVRLPAGSVVRDHTGRIAHEVSITPIPLDRTPFPLPPDVNPPAYFTIQPGAGYVYGPNGGARIVYPNRFAAHPGAGHSFWHYDPGGEGWYVYGLGHVTPDGAQIVPDPGVSVYEFTGAMVGAGPPLPPDGPRPCANRAECVRDGDPVDLGTGLFVLTKTDVVLPGPLPIVLQRTYRSGDTAVRVFGRGSTHNYALFIRTSPGYQDGYLVLPDGGRVRLVRTNGGSGSLDGIFTHTETPTPWVGLDLRYVAPRWVMTLKDGTIYEFDVNWGLLQRIQDRFGNWLQITLGGGQGNLSRIETSAGRWLAFTYPPGSQLIQQIQDNLGRVWAYAYDGAGRLQTVTDPEGAVTTYTYDAASHRMLTLRDARNILFLTNEYNAQGRVFRQTQADSTTYQFAYTLDGQGKVTQADVTDPRGRVRRATFNAAGYPLSDTRALGQPEQQTRTYERQAGTNLRTAEVDALGRRTEYTYDAKGNVTSVTRLAGTGNAVTTTFTYDPTFSQVTSVSDPLNHTTTFGFSPSGALTSITDPLQHQTVITPDVTGQPAGIRDPLNQITQFTYDAGDLVATTDPLGRTTTRFLDGAGRVVQLTDPLGQSTRHAYDRLNRLTQVLDAQGGTTAFAYDPNGNLLSVTDARTNQTTYSYNTMDRLETRTDPLLQAETYQYDNNGNLTQVTDRKNQVTIFTYDGLNRRTQTQFHDASTITVTHDAGNRVTQLVDSANGTVTRSYDGLDRLTSETTPKGTVSYTYDAANRRTTMTVSGQPQVSYAYDNADRLTQITRNATTVTYGYDDANRRTSLTLPNGVVIESGYDTASRLTGLTYRLGPTPLGALTYGYDPGGNRIQVEGSWARTNLPPAVGSATYDAANRLTQWGAATLTYDDNGNLTSDATQTYTWNVRDQLASLPGASFQYDAFGRRQRRVVGTATTEWVYDGLTPVQEQDGIQVTVNQLTGLGIDEYLARLEGSTARYFLPDALGSTVALADPAGAVQTEYTYAPFGETTSTGQAFANPHQFTGRENDGTGLYYYRARYYHPGLHRFVSEDPLRFRSGQLNPYVYVGSNPVRFNDPLGLWAINASDQPIIVKPEQPGLPNVVVGPHDIYRGNIDGLKSPGGPWFKVVGRGPINTNVTVLPDGTYVPSGPGSFVPPIKDEGGGSGGWRDHFPGPKDPDWTSPDRHPDWNDPPGGPGSCGPPMCGSPPGSPGKSG